MSTVKWQTKEYPTEPLKSWNDAKGLRSKFYQAYVDAHDKGGIRYAGSTIGFHSIMRGFGKDVYNLAGEPYGATTAFFKDFSIQCEEACEKAGISRDLCSYMRNYWGSVIMNKMVLPDGTVLDKFPKPDVLLTSHICCSHAKWYQYVSELENGIPLFAVDLGPRAGTIITKEAIDYWTAQLLEAIEFMEKKLGRKFSDELFIESINNELTSYSVWADICTYNQTIPAPLDEKSMFSLYVFNTMCPHWEETVDFYYKLREEVRDRVNRGIAAVPNERFRIITDSQPPWGFLSIFRYMEKEYGVVSVGSVYSTGFASWDFDDEGKFIALKTPRDKGIELKDREQAARIYAEYKMHGWDMMLGWSNCHLKSDFMLRMVKQWKANAVVIHLNRGCEGVAVGQMENKIALTEAGFPVLTYEGNMGDNRDFDFGRTVSRIDAFFENMGLRKLSEGG